MNWSYSSKVGFFFAMYQIMRSKVTSWDGPRPNKNMFTYLRRPYRKTIYKKPLGMNPTV